MEAHRSCGGVTCSFGGLSDPPTISWTVALPRPRSSALKRCPCIWSTNPRAFSVEQACSNFGKTLEGFLILLLDTAGHPGDLETSVHRDAQDQPHNTRTRTQVIFPTFLDPAVSFASYKNTSDPRVLVLVRATTSLLRRLPSCHQPPKIHEDVFPGFGCMVGEGNQRVDVESTKTNDEPGIQSPESFLRCPL